MSDEIKLNDAVIAEISTITTDINRRMSEQIAELLTSYVNDMDIELKVKDNKLNLYLEHPNYEVHQFLTVDLFSTYPFSGWFDEVETHPEDDIERIKDINSYISSFQSAILKLEKLKGLNKNGH